VYNLLSDFNGLSLLLRSKTQKATNVTTDILQEFFSSLLRYLLLIEYMFGKKGASASMGD